ncbi:MAG: glycosyltransferase family 9 protein [Bacteroidota bacterium]
MGAPPDLGSVRKVLVIKLRAIGDVLLSTIVTKNLRLTFPGAIIHYLTERPSAPVLQGNPFVDGVKIYDRATMHGLDLIKAIRRERYDLVIDLFGNPRTALATRLSGASIRGGFRFRGRTYAYNVVATPRGNRVHNTEFNLDALRALGIEIQDRTIYFTPSANDETYVDAFLKRGRLAWKRLVCLNAGGGWYTKKWGADRFAALGDLITKAWGATVVLVWGPGEKEAVERIGRMMRRTPLIAPSTTLGQLGALLRRSFLLVTNDSGPMHLAAAVGTPILAIFGPTNPKLQGPYGVPHAVVRNESLTCLGCNLVKCPIGHPCMLNLSVDEVFMAGEELMARLKQGVRGRGKGVGGGHPVRNPQSTIRNRHRHR